MTDLEFALVGAEPDAQAASPSINLRLRIAEASGAAVHALALRCQLRIETVRRRYSDTEADALRDLFGERSRWGDSLKPVQLGFANQVVPTFTGSTEIDVALPCSYDFDVAAHKYLYALEDGEIPLLALFSGTAFTVADGSFTVAPIPWDREARFRLPVAVFQRTMQLHFPGTAWLRVGTDTFDALHRYRIREQLLTWDDALQRLLKEADP